MTGSDVHDAHPRKLLARGATKIKIAVAGGLVLAAGAWMAPRPVPSGLSTSEERAAPLLEEQAQLRQAARPFVGVQDVAAPVGQHGVAILEPGIAPVPSRTDFAEAARDVKPTSGFGVFISDTHVLTHIATLNGRTTAELSVAPAQTADARVVAYDRATSLVLLQVPRSEGRSYATLATSAPPVGALAVAAARSDEREYAVPVFVTTVGGGEYLLSQALLPGMPVFDLSGELFAIAAPDGQDARALPVREAAARMLADASSGERRASFGFSFQAPTERLADTFGNEGVIITDVVSGGPGHAADIRIGDVLLAIGDVQTDSSESTLRALSTAAIGAPATLRIRRRTRVFDVQGTPKAVYEIAALARANHDAPSGPEARDLFLPDLLAGSAIPPSAQVLSVNGRKVTTRAQVDRELRSAAGAVPVLLRQGTHQFFAAVERRR